MHVQVLLVALTFSLLAITVPAIASPSPTPAAKRQIDPELLALASAVGITSLPSDPAKLSTIAILVSGITAQLPPSPVLSVLETAVPSSLISELGSNPESLGAFASQFSAGSTPGWYSSLPASVKSFFRTYSADFSDLRSAESSITSILNSQSSAGASGASISTQTVSVSTTTATLTATATVTTTTGTSENTSQGAAVRAITGIEASLLGFVGVLAVLIGL